MSKERVYHKATYKSLSSCLLDLRESYLPNDVLELAMPRIACGLDGLDWIKVRKLIQWWFQDTNISINIYTGYSTNDNNNCAVVTTTCDTS